MNRRFYIAAIITASFLTSCAATHSSPEVNDQAVSRQAGKTGAESEIIFDDKDFPEDASMATRKNAREITKLAPDGSRIDTMYDGYGNKTETRHFSDSRLKFVMLNTSASGQKQVFVYGQNGEVKSLPANMLDKVLTASANEIAGAAGIYEVRMSAPQPAIVQNQQPLKPLPSSKFPIQKPSVETVPAEMPPSPTTVETPKSPAQTTDIPKGKSENSPPKNQSN